jgi:tetratricopeptide (TPR) repeat protein
MFKNFRRIWIAPAVVVVVLGIYFIPPVHERMARRVDDVRSQVKYFFDPPEQAVFLPTQQAAIDAIVNATMEAHALEQTATATPVVTPPTPAGPTALPTTPPTPLLASVNLPGAGTVNQHGVHSWYTSQDGGWNLCAPSNLTMALRFWGWTGSRDDVIRVVKPGENDPSKSDVDRGKTDKNVMPYELVDFVNNDTKFKALQRYGGDVDLVRKLVANGFPVLPEKGIYEEDTTLRTSWMGHYQFVNGYDDATRTFLVQDSYKKGPNYRLSYSDFEQQWQSFDRVFIVVYPADREGELMSLLGPYADPQWAAQHALDMAVQDTRKAVGAPLFFAWFDQGTSDVALQRYVDAANAYDQAFTVYATLDPNYSTRPWRMMWYQTGPYWAYFYSGRYQDVIRLANITLDPSLLGVNTLEESLYWRGMAEYSLGDTAHALDDVRRSVYYNKNFQAGIAKLQEWGSAP